MAKCSKAGINTPTLYLIDNVNHVIYMEFIEGITVKEYLRNNQDNKEYKDKIKGMKNKNFYRCCDIHINF